MPMLFELSSKLKRGPGLRVGNFQLRDTKMFLVFPDNYSRAPIRSQLAFS
jgi:hypothetical protein